MQPHTNETPPTPQKPQTKPQIPAEAPNKHPNVQSHKNSETKTERLKQIHEIKSLQGGFAINKSSQTMNPKIFACKNNEIVATWQENATRQTNKKLKNWSDPITDFFNSRRVLAKLCLQVCREHIHNDRTQNNQKATKWKYRWNMRPSKMSVSVRDATKLAYKSRCINCRKELLCRPCRQNNHNDQHKQSERRFHEQLALG